MCGAFSIRLNPWERTEIDKSLVPSVWKPIYNARPGELLPIIPANNTTRITMALWNYLPHWMKDSKGKGVINAKSETISTKPYFRDSFQKRRCIIPADGFYEWELRGKFKVPHFFHRKDNKQFAFAGIYDQLPGAQDRLGFAIITTTPNKVVQPIHDRMPVMLEEDQVKSWLSDETTMTDAKNLLDPFPSDLMASYEVSREVNSARNKGSNLVEPIS